LAGRENICEAGYQGLYLGSGAGCWGKEPHNEHGGCFSKVMRIESKFAIKLPESEVACPFICGGGTMFEPVVNYVTNGTRVAIASVGGLGTAGIKFAKSFGGHVTALSRSEDKRSKALSAGADEFYVLVLVMLKQLRSWLGSLTSLLIPVLQIATSEHLTLSTGLSTCLPFFRTNHTMLILHTVHTEEDCW